MLAAHDTEFPTIRAELERKTIEEVQRLAHCLQTARISADGYKACMTTLWNCVAGLVEKSTMELIAQLANQPVPNGETDRIVRVLRDEKGWIFVFSYRFGDTKAYLKRIAPDGASTEVAMEPPAGTVQIELGAMRRMTEAVSKMIALGYQIIL